jgi:uncharacterized protein (DUF4415 family)
MQKPKKDRDLTPDQAMRFLEDVRELYRGVDEPTQAISIRIPRNVLRAFKTKAEAEGKKYQSVIVSLMREWVASSIQRIRDNKR